MTLAVNIAQSGSSNVTFRNKLINGGMVIDQRNNGASTTSGTNNGYTLDRWATQNNSGASRFTVQRNAGSITPPAGYSNYLGCTSTGAYTVSSGDAIGMIQRIEGFNSADLAFGVAGAKAVTLSFWVYSSLTGTFGGSLFNGDGNYSYPFTYTISSANTWEYETITIAGATAGTWSTSNSTGLNVLFALGTGSSLSGTAGSWSANGYYGATGQTQWVATNGATFYITGVQLETGTTASPFEYRQYGTELALCQRYYFSVSGGIYLAGKQDGTTLWVGSVSTPVSLRASPSISSSAGGTTRLFTAAGYKQGSGNTFTLGSISDNKSYLVIQNNTFTGLSDNVVATMRYDGSLDFSAEL